MVIHYMSHGPKTYKHEAIGNGRMVVGDPNTLVQSIPVPVSNSQQGFRTALRGLGLSVEGQGCSVESEEARKES